MASLTSSDGCHGSPSGGRRAMGQERRRPAALSRIPHTRDVANRRSMKPRAVGHGCDSSSRDHATPWRRYGQDTTDPFGSRRPLRQPFQPLTMEHDRGDSARLGRSSCAAVLRDDRTLPRTVREVAEPAAPTTCTGRRIFVYLPVQNGMRCSETVPRHSAVSRLAVISNNLGFSTYSPTGETSRDSGRGVGGKPCYP
jgi:hypothetical protein